MLNRQNFENALTALAEKWNWFKIFSINHSLPHLCLQVCREVSSDELDTILARLATPYEKKYRGCWREPTRPNFIRDEDECQAIFQRLGEFDIKKGPPGSNGGKVHLGQGRYDFGPGPKHQKPGPYRSPGEVASIIERLSTFDITKGPPGSRGHEKR